jgi:hydrogenase-1 operon protein HyaF
MKDSNFFDDDHLVDALLVEIAGLMSRLIEHGEEAAIDLLGLPMAPTCVADLERRLGRGEIFIQLDAFGRSEIYETRFSGVWWAQHLDEGGRVIARLIEVAFVPNILRADGEDIKTAREKLLASTNAVQTTSRSAA